MTYFDVLIIGASASGLMCAIEAGKRGRKVIVLDHAAKVGKKIRISGGGRCNFSNYDVSADHYLSQNRHYCKSALSRYQYYDFLSLLAEYNIPWHERDHGQLFCDRSANDIVQMLLSECEKYSISIQLACHINSVANNSPLEQFQIDTSTGDYQAGSLVIATGGLSVTKMGASDFGLRIAKQFALHIIPTRPGLVPLSYNAKDSKRYKQLSGIALEAEITYGDHSFKENLLFTHKGLSGPAVLQISSYWLVEAGRSIQIKLLPELAEFKQQLQIPMGEKATSLKDIDIRIKEMVIQSREDIYGELSESQILMLNELNPDLNIKELLSILSDDGSRQNLIFLLTI